MYIEFYPENRRRKDDLGDLKADARILFLKK
jgi:hypothetical protein